MILLTILKFILIAFLCILAFIMFVCAVILLTPIRYDLDGKKDLFYGKITWLFHCVRLYFTYENEIFSYKAYILWFRLFKPKKNKPNKKQVSIKKPIEKTAKEIKEAAEKMATRKEETKDNLNKTVDETTAANQSNINEKQNGHTYSDTKNKTNDNTKKSADDNYNSDKRKFSIEKILKIIENYKEYPDKDKIFHYTKQFIKNIFKAIMPKKVLVQGSIGLSDSFHTGILSAFTATLGSYCESVDITGNFVEKGIFLEGKLKGSIMLGKFLWYSLIYVIKKPIRQLLFKMFRKYKEG